MGFTASENWYCNAHLDVFSESAESYLSAEGQSKELLKPDTGLVQRGDLQRLRGKPRNKLVWKGRILSLMLLSLQLPSKNETVEQKTE